MLIQLIDLEGDNVGLYQTDISPKGLATLYNRYIDSDDDDPEEFDVYAAAATGLPCERVFVEVATVKR